ncbi:hypothetical protein PC129_g14717 [Phytophthora cactorum]|uniref:Uncharacterized protein n=1 Tax=Phytophthora cactorum TaxID=29920 RepID=A0A8T1HR60_9STRA|nr:hypothetical protein PC129_g14717 [Phytophthora cactorum]
MLRSKDDKAVNGHTTDDNKLGGEDRIYRTMKARMDGKALDMRTFGGVRHVEDVLGHCGHRLVNVPDGRRRSSPRERSSPKESAGSRRSPAWTTKTWWLKQNASSWDISWKDEPLRTIAWAYQPVSSAEVTKNWRIIPWTTPNAKVTAN